MITKRTIEYELNLQDIRRACCKHIDGDNVPDSVKMYYVIDGGKEILLENSEALLCKIVYEKDNLQ